MQTIVNERDGTSQYGLTRPDGQTMMSGTGQRTSGNPSRMSNEEMLSTGNAIEASGVDQDGNLEMGTTHRLILLI